MKCNIFLSLYTIAIMLFTLSAGYSQSALTHSGPDMFEARLDSLRKVYRVPGLSVAVIHQDSILYTGGMGYADINAGLEATPLTTYRIASLTKPIASTILLKQQQEGQLSIHDSIKTCIPGYEAYYSEVKAYVLANQPEYASMIQDFHFERDDISIWHHLTHTAEKEPGSAFKYNGFLFGALSRVMEVKEGKPFHHIVEEQILQPCHMTLSAPSQAQATGQTLQLLARPYQYLVEKDSFVLSAYPSPKVNAASGIVSNVVDQAKFDKAINNHHVINANTQEAAWTKQLTNDGQEIPYGLGWFVQHHNGERVVWHYGWQPEAFSGLYLKFPDSGYTFILLANGENLSAPFVESGYDHNVFVSPFAKLFYDSFIKK